MEVKEQRNQDRMSFQTSVTWVTLWYRSEGPYLEQDEPEAHRLPGSRFYGFGS